MINIISLCVPLINNNTFLLLANIYILYIHKKKKTEQIIYNS